MIESIPEDESIPEEGSLRVYWIPQVPMDPFHWNVDTVEEAARTIHMLAEYDIFLFNTKVRSDFANAGGLEIFEGGEWVEWESADGDDIHTLTNEL